MSTDTQQKLHQRFSALHLHLELIKKSHDTNLIISYYSINLPDSQKEFLSNVKETMAAVSYWRRVGENVPCNLVKSFFIDFTHIFRMQGVFMPHRGENKGDIDEMLAKVVDTLGKKMP